MPVPNGSGASIESERPEGEPFPAAVFKHAEAPRIPSESAVIFPKIAAQILCAEIPESRKSTD